MADNQTQTETPVTVPVDTPPTAQTEAPTPPTTDPTFVRQAPLRLMLPRSVSVIGCGGVGSWLAYFLALAGVPELWLWDSDHVSDHNLNRLPYPRSFEGKSKSEALVELIKPLRPNCLMFAMTNWTPDLANSVKLAEVNDFIVVTTDTLRSRREIYDWTKKSGSINLVGPRYIEAAAEGEFGSITGEPAQWATPDEERPGYASVPVWVGPCVFAAAAACAYIVHSETIGDGSVRLGFISPADREVTDSAPEEHYPAFLANFVQDTAATKHIALLKKANAYEAERRARRAKQRAEILARQQEAANSGTTATIPLTAQEGYDENGDWVCEYHPVSNGVGLRGNQCPYRTASENDLICCEACGSYFCHAHFAIHTEVEHTSEPDSEPDIDDVEEEEES